jgi:dolichol-phosphate mannosyltransferase
MSLELAVIMPVFNEEASIRRVVSEWFAELESQLENFILIVLNDGSRDETLDQLKEMEREKGCRLLIVDQVNIGHGRTCLKGYQMAIELGAKWILQIDSDGQCDPLYFSRFWRERHHNDLIFGRRTQREDGLRRIFVSVVLKWLLLLLYHVNCIDPNVPYRLMRAEVIRPILPHIQGVDLANIALSIFLQQRNNLRAGVVDISFRARYGGEPTVGLLQFAAKAAELKKQLDRIM